LYCILLYCIIRHYCVAGVLLFTQKYLWFKKASPYWDMDCPFPMSIDMMVRDSLELVRPKEVFSQSYLEANQKAEKLNDEFKEKLCK